MYSVNKLGRNYKVGVPLSDDYRHRVLELSQNHSCREVSDILGIQPSTVLNILKRYRATGQTASLPKDHVIIIIIIIIKILFQHVSHFN